MTPLNSFVKVICSVSVLSQSGGWMHELTIRLNSASVEVKAEAELGNFNPMHL